ncbi:tripartite tricarboxylate transporter TctB family protein [Pelagibius sp.]|uniref:tripartite tricarboxylate transporter TctB family protein n=1 Tax=Pelagibius sp. TaxID=1931238 RepID=UPI003BAFD21B
MLSDRLYGLGFIILGSITGFMSVDYGVYSDIGPAPGTFPLVISILFVLFSVPLLLKRDSDKAKAERPASTFSVASTSVTIIVVSAAYAVILPHLGVGLTSLAALATLGLVLHKGNRMIVMIVAVCGGAAMEFIFWYLLGVYLPASNRIVSAYLGGFAWTL